MRLRLLLSMLLIVSGLASGSSPALAEPPDCSDAIDNDGDGLTDFPDDPECSTAEDETEVEPATECNDGTDNDGDGLSDYPDDPKCDHSEDTTEVAQCADGVDNDNDGTVDFPADQNCDSPSDDAEQPGCLDVYSSNASSSSCFPTGLTIRFDRDLHAFRGALMNTRKECRKRAEVVVRRVRPGPNIALGSVLTNRRGRWRLPMSGYVKGRFYAEVIGRALPSTSGTTIECPGDRSVTIRVRARN
jgi:hypothetical protein